MPAGCNLGAGLLLQVQQECAVTGFLAIRGHGISTDTLQQLFATARQLFDLSYEQKMQLVVKEMKAGRGYEISPEHKAYMQVGEGWGPLPQHSLEGSGAQYGSQTHSLTQSTQWISTTTVAMRPCSRTATLLCSCIGGRALPKVP